MIGMRVVDGDLFKGEPIFITKTNGPQITHPSERALQEALIEELCEDIEAVNSDAVIIDVLLSECTTMQSSSPEYLVIRTEVIPDPRRPEEPGPQEDFDRRLTELENKIGEVRQVVESILITLERIVEEDKS